jgi:signal transduction histidine kinase
LSLLPTQTSISEKLAIAGRMAATVAHEINNPLEAVTNALYLLSESPSLDDGARQFLAIAQDELAAIRHIATATRGLHRGDADSPQPVKVSELIDNVFSLYGRKLRALGIAVETRYETDIPVTPFLENCDRCSQTSLSMPSMRLRNLAINSVSTSSRLSTG